MPQSYVKHMLVAFFIHTTLNCTRTHINDYPRKILVLSFYESH